ncbi:MAG: AI-2E family transporter [Litoreibacter sp.]
MALPVQQQMKYWGIASVIFLLSLWFLGDVMLPFIVGGAIAYMLDPVADRLQAMGLGRVASTTLISLVALIVILPILIFVSRSMVEQAIELFDTAPDLFRRLQTFLSDNFPALRDESSTLRQILDSVALTIQERGGEFAKNIFTSALGVINAVVFVVVVPVVSFYLLLDWDNMIARIDQLLPRDHAPTIRRLSRDIDQTLANFARGQITVCSVLAAFYAVLLMLVGLQFGLVVGVVAGLISFIPYIGALVGGVMAFGLALYQFWGDPIWIVAVAIIFGAGQFLEGNILTPKLVGESVGLHPVWLIFALSVFGSIFGFVGMLVAVPVAASLGVLTRFGVSIYQESVLYRGLGSHDQDESDEI